MSAIYGAKKFFEDNTGRINANTDPVLFNINNGLTALVKGLDAEIGALKRQNDEILQALRNLRR